MTMVPLLAAASAVPGDPGAPWPVHFGWLGLVLLLGFAGLGLSALTSRGAPRPMLAARRSVRDARLLATA